MASLQLDSLSSRANTLFDECIKSQVVNEDPDNFLAIDIESGDYEIAADDLTPGEILRARHQNAQIFVRRVGDEAVYTVGGGYQA